MAAMPIKKFDTLLELPCVNGLSNTVVSKIKSVANKVMAINRSEK